MDIEITRDDERHRYKAIKDGHESYVSYKVVGTRALDFQHTFVPPSLRGQGIAEALVRYGMEDARARGLKVIPTCPFVRAFIARHPEVQDLAVDA